jgi:hypothetical protein
LAGATDGVGVGGWMTPVANVVATIFGSRVGSPEVSSGVPQDVTATAKRIMAMVARAG